MTTLRITLKPNSTDTLAIFPKREDQYIEESENADTVTVTVFLGDRSDTTAAQEQYLNTNDNVVSYEIRK